MRDFDYYNPTHIVFGKDRLKELDFLVPKGAKVLILYGVGSAQRHGTIEKACRYLKGREIHKFGGIEPNPQYQTLMKAVKVAKENRIDFLLAIGGGSVMDGTKFIALAAKHKGSGILELLRSYSLGSLSEALPLGVVVTLPATGSEMNKGGVISHEDGKFHFSNPLVFPEFSILDPTLTFTLPLVQVANGIMDTFVHVLEVYVTSPAEARFQDRAAEGILLTLIEIGRKAMDNPEDYESRANLMWCSTMALNGILGVGVPQDWSAHMIGHELTWMFGIDHGRTLAVLIPAIWSVMKDFKKEKLLQYAKRVWNINYGEDSIRIDLAIDKTREFFESLGIKTRLSDYAIKREDIGRVLEALEKHGMTSLGESGRITPEVVRRILEKAL